VCRRFKAVATHERLLGMAAEVEKYLALWLVRPIRQPTCQLLSSESDRFVHIRSFEREDNSDSSDARDPPCLLFRPSFSLMAPFSIYYQPNFHTWKTLPPLLLLLHLTRVNLVLNQFPLPLHPLAPVLSRKLSIGLLLANAGTKNQDLQGIVVPVTLFEHHY
jgi:hypothetical protein